MTTVCDDIPHTTATTHLKVEGLVEVRADGLAFLLGSLAVEFDVVAPEGDVDVGVARAIVLGQPAALNHPEAIDTVSRVAGTVH